MVQHEPHSRRGRPFTAQEHVRIWTSSFERRRSAELTDAAPESVRPDDLSVWGWVVDAEGAPAVPNVSGAHLAEAATAPPSLPPRRGSSGFKPPPRVHRQASVRGNALGGAKARRAAHRILANARLFEWGDGQAEPRFKASANVFVAHPCASCSRF